MSQSLEERDSGEAEADDCEGGPAGRRCQAVEGGREECHDGEAIGEELRTGGVDELEDCDEQDATLEQNAIHIAKLDPECSTS